jgi:phosphoglycolate phosphatase
MPGSLRAKRNVPDDSKKTILFDFDGTIADTVDAGVEIFNGLARKYGFSEITDENAQELRAKGPRAAMKALEVPMRRVPTVLRSLRSGIRSALPSVEAIEGMRTTLLDLREKGYQLGIVTSNSTENVRQFLKDHQMEFFDYIQAGTGIFNKASKIKKVMKREELKCEETIFVGDEIRDIEAAKKNNMTAIAVTWGLNSREGLESAEPDFIVESTRELVELFQSTANKN